MRLQLNAVPMASAAFRELFEVAGEEALSAAGEWLDILRSSPSRPPGIGVPVRRHPAAAMEWAAVVRIRAELDGVAKDSNPRKRPHSLSSSAALTAANAAWRLVHDPRLQARLAKAGAIGLMGLPLDATARVQTRHELVDLVLAITACVLASDGVRQVRSDLRRDTKRPWYESSNSKVLRSIYLSDAAVRLIPASVRKRRGMLYAPELTGKGTPHMWKVRCYDRSACRTLAQHVLEVTCAWSAPDWDVMSWFRLSRRAMHWSEAALTQIWIWLGHHERKQHSRADTPW